MSKNAGLTLIAVAALAAPPARAGEATLLLDPARTKVSYTLDALLHTVHGTFRLTRGSVRFDTATGKARGEIAIAADSGGSGSEARDRRMSKSVLEAAKFPEITFAPDRIEGRIAPQGPSSVRLHGVFTLHGAGHELTLNATVERTPEGLAFTARFAVPYAQWGLKSPSTLFLRVAESTEIEVEGVGKVAGL